MISEGQSGVAKELLDGIEISRCKFGMLKRDASEPRWSTGLVEFEGCFCWLMAGRKIFLFSVGFPSLGCLVNTDHWAWSILTTHRNTFRHPMSKIDRRRCANWRIIGQMGKRKTEKRVRKAAVAQIAKEMAKPRQPASVRRELRERNEKRPADRALIMKNNI